MMQETNTHAFGTTHFKFNVAAGKEALANDRSVLSRGHFLTIGTM